MHPRACLGNDVEYLGLQFVKKVNANEDYNLEAIGGNCDMYQCLVRIENVLQKS